MTKPTRTMTPNYIVSFALLLFTQQLATIGASAEKQQQIVTPAVVDDDDAPAQTPAPTSFMEMDWMYDVVKAWLCDPEVMVASGDRVLPIKIEYSPNSTIIYPFNQGTNVTVCVALEPEAYEEGFEIKRLRRFDWVRDNWNDDDFYRIGDDYYYGTGDDYWSTYYDWTNDDDWSTDDDWTDDDWTDDDDWSVEQLAIRNGKSSHYLTDYWQDDCIVKGWCSFTTILYADFYMNTGQVVGNGVATIGYRDNQKQSQELYTTNAFFNITVDVAPKKRLITPRVYNWLCDPTSMESLDDYYRVLPKQIPSCDFRVGDVVTVCIAVGDTPYENGVVIANVTDFHWTNDWTYYWKDVYFWGDGEIIQAGIRDGNVLDSTLTSFRQEDCEGKDWCSFSTILSDKFFNETDQFYGVGSVFLKYQNDSIEESERKFNLEDEDDLHVSMSFQTDEDWDAYVSSTWVANDLRQCRDYTPDYDEQNYEKYISQTCTSQGQAYVQCRAADADCAHSMCPDIDAQTIMDTFPLELTRIFTLTMAYRSITSPYFCFELGGRVCYSDLAEYGCCCQEEYAEWQDCLIANDLPKMVETTIGIGTAPICTVECVQSASTAQVATSSSSSFSSKQNIGIGAVVAIGLVSFEYWRRVKLKDRDEETEQHGEFNEAP